MLSLNLSENKSLNNVRSQQYLQLNLDSKMSKKKQIRLLNAKLKQLKNKCRVLRQQSKTQREMLSNLMSQTQCLQNKTNSGIQACKQVCTQILDNHNSQMKTKGQINMPIQNLIPVSSLVIYSNCSDPSSLLQSDRKQSNLSAKFQNQVQNYIQQQNNNIQQLQKLKLETKQSINNAKTSRSLTQSSKSEEETKNKDGNEAKTQANNSNKYGNEIQNKIFSTTTLPSEQNQSNIKQINTLSSISCQDYTENQSKKASITPKSFKSLKSSTSSQRNYIKPNKFKFKSAQKNIKNYKTNLIHQKDFINYFYAITVVIILTIIFKFTFF